MATQYTSILKLALPTDGELDGTWGDVVNNNITSMVEEAVAGLATINSWTTNSHTLTTANGVTSESRAAILVLTDTGASLTGAGELICPAASKVYIVRNTTGQTITIKTSAGTGVAVADGDVQIVFCDGTNVIPTRTTLTDLGVTASAAELNILDGVTATTAELNYVDGVTSAIQTQIDSKAGSLSDLSVTATAAELNILDGATVTTAELNILDGVTATTSELNILDGVTATTSELNILDGVTATTAELNILDGVTATTAELNYVDGVTSAIQTQIDGINNLLDGTTAVSALTVSGDLKFNGYSPAVDYDFDGNGSVTSGDALAYAELAGGVATGVDISATSTLEVSWAALSGTIYSDNKFRVLSARGNFSDALQVASSLSAEGYGDTTVIGNVNVNGTNTRLVGGIGVSGQSVTLVNNGAEKLRTTSNGVVVSGSLTVDDGSDSAPSITFTNDSDTGWYRTASGTIAFSSNGVMRGVEFGASYNYLNKQSVGGFTEYVRINSVLPRIEYNVTFSGDSVNIFRYQDAVKGSIVVTSTATAYNTSSDYRLKENVVPIENAVARIDNLNPVRFNFISDPSQTVDGFLAHEVTAVVPEAITGEKDAVDDEGNPVYQGIDQSKLVPLLVAAIQELSARVAALEAN